MTTTAFTYMMIYRIPPMFAVLQPMTLQWTGKLVPNALLILLFFVLMAMQSHIINMNAILILG